MLKLVFYLASGRLLIWFLQTSGLMHPIWRRNPILNELGQCDLCLGFWVYLGLGSFSQSETAQAQQDFGLWPRFIEVIVQAAMSSFIMHLVRLGWQMKFGGVIIDD